MGVLVVICEALRPARTRCLKILQQQPKATSTLPARVAAREGDQYALIMTGQPLRISLARKVKTTCELVYSLDLLHFCIIICNILLQGLSCATERHELDRDLLCSRRRRIPALLLTVVVLLLFVVYPPSHSE